MTAGNFSETELPPHSASLSAQGNGRPTSSPHHPSRRPLSAPSFPPGKDKGFLGGTGGLVGGRGRGHEGILTPMRLYFNFLRTEFLDHLCVSVFLPGVPRVKRALFRPEVPNGAKRLRLRGA